MATTARGQITIVDLNDAKQVQIYLENSGADTQIYNPNTNEWTPNFVTAPLVITPKIFITGSAADQIANCSGFAYTVNGTAATADSGAFVLDSKKGTLTIKNNMTVDFYQIVFSCTYNDGLRNDVIKGYKTITRNKDGGSLFSVIVTTPKGTVFNQNQTSNLTAVATAYRGGAQDTAGTTYRWEKLVSGAWTAVAAASVSTANNVSTLTVKADDVLDYQTYRVTASDKRGDGKGDTSVALITFQDMTDPYQVEVMSNTGDKILNGTGSTTLFARVYQAGVLVEDSSSASLTASNAKFSYSWTLTDKDGNKAYWDTAKTKEKDTSFKPVVNADIVNERITVHLEVTKK